MFSNKVSVLLQQEEQKRGPCPNAQKPMIGGFYMEIVNYLYGNSQLFELPWWLRW